MEYSVIVTPRARRDLQQILEFIGRDNLLVARKITDELVDQTASLAKFARLGRVVPEFDQENARELIFRHYRIIYRVFDSNRIIYVIRFWHAARGIPSIK